jgi:hypothetical protein
VQAAEVTLVLQSDTNKQELTLSNSGPGRFEGSFEVLQGGDYQFTGTAHQQGNILGRDSGKFSVEQFSLEFQNTRMNENLLRRIASESNGDYFTPADITGLEKKMKFPKKYIHLKSEFEFWNQTWTLLACLLLLSTEWFIRKRKGML